MAEYKKEEIELRNVKLDTSRNHFDGAAGDFNAPGARNFTVVFNLPDEEETVNDLVSRGWPININPDRTLARLKVHINYKYGAPLIQMLEKTPARDKMGNFMYSDPEHKIQLFHINEVWLDEETSKEIQNFKIENIKILINLGTYKVGGGGVAAYLQEMQFVKKQGRFALDIDALSIEKFRPDLMKDCELPF